MSSVFWPTHHHCLLWISIVLSLLSFAELTNVNRMSIVKINEIGTPDSGTAESCGPPINFTWTPKDLYPSGQVTVNVAYKLPYTLDGGYFNATLYFHGESTPFLGYADYFTCDQMKAYIPCPIIAGIYINTSKTITNLHLLTSYPGMYDAIVQVWNKEGQYILCIKLTLTINESDALENDALENDALENDTL